MPGMRGLRRSRTCPAGRMRSILFLILAGAAQAQPPDPTELLIKARNILSERAQRLPDYTCVQTVDRRYYRRPRTNYLTPDCEQIHSLPNTDLMLEHNDRMRLELKMSQGLEIGSWPGSRFTSRNIFEMIGGGAYGTGMLGALISDIFINSGAAYQYNGHDAVGEAYSFQVPVDASHYQVRAGSSWTVTAFRGAFWLDAGSLDLKRLTVDASSLPPETGACEAKTEADYQKVKVGTGEFLLPQRSSMRLVMQDETETEVAAVYTGCREYRGEATIRFDQAAAAGGETSVPGPAGPLPEGLQLSVAFSEPIDTDTAAAGDMVHARLRKPARDRVSKAVLVPAGAVIEGRIVGMEHWRKQPSHFRISLVLEKLESGGVERPLYAKIQRKSDMVMVTQSMGIVVPPVGQSPLAAAFVFPSNKDRYLVPAGYESEWLTVEAPAGEKK